MDPSILIVVLVFMATVGATFSGFKTVNLIVKGGYMATVGDTYGRADFCCSVGLSFAFYVLNI